MTDKHERHECVICGKTFPRRDLFPCSAVRDSIASRITSNHPNWTRDGFICKHDLVEYGVDYVHSLLDSEKGELTNIEQQILHSIREHELLARNIDSEFESSWSLGQKLSDGIARFGGSWTFMLVFAAFLVLWIVMNTRAFALHAPDPYPFTFLNLLLSCVAAIQAPIIMMSQNRQAAKDRLRSQNDYLINLKAELEVRNLHDKMNHLLSHQWDRLALIQEIQLDLLSAIFKENESHSGIARNQKAGI